MTRAFSPTDPHATPLHGHTPYQIERRVLAGVPCLIECPVDGVEIRALCIVYHGAWAAKEGKLGVYSALVARGVAMVIPDAALHGERQSDTPPSLNAREYVWESVRRTVAEASALIDALGDLFGPRLAYMRPMWVVGSSMGGYVAQTLMQTERRVSRVAALITSGVWAEPEVRQPELVAFLDAYRPVTHSGQAAPIPFLLASGEADPTFPLAAHHAPTAAAYREAYAQAGAAHQLHEATFAGVGHYTSVGMRDHVLRFFLADPNFLTDFPAESDA
ncbi:serine aminopeptidase domain-containing protein [Deinococcus sp. QL22]|uniref:serine aminopeptidase domain-containing protein n=1 Tax=Deinococcus sp. QL22 TaxID=2939437 RepID=UPI002016F667|nr:alpha/beta hydrolase [Deinococcus sp. QL22]UQN06393.1 alpha/beta hydrolase [Deinococcus sp. QL22]